MVIKQYEIIVTDTKKTVEMMNAEWIDVQKRLVELNKQGKGVFAQGAGNNSALVPKRSFSDDLEPGYQHIFVDAECKKSGNSGKGIGGYQITDKDGKRLSGATAQSLHTNNFFELYAIVKGIEYVIHAYKEWGDNHSGKTPLHKKCIIYSDSQTAISWLNSRTHKATADQESIGKLIAKGFLLLKYNKDQIELVKYDTAKYGEIPADFGNKK